MRTGLIAIYSRKSKYTGKGESIGNQVELCREYVRSHYGEQALERVMVFEDEGFSGGNMNRPGFQKMMELAEKRSVCAIIVYRLDRISRNIGDFAGMIEKLSGLDVAFVSIREQFDTATPMGRAMMYIASVFSQLERETIAERIRDNMHELAKSGRWLGGTTPTGYISETAEKQSADGKSRKSCYLRLIPEEAEKVRLIFELYGKYGSQARTEAELLRLGICTKNGRSFSRFAIKAILQNPVYMQADFDAYEYFIRNDAELFSERETFDGVHGMMVYNRTRQEKGKTTQVLPVNKWIVVVGAHRGIVSGRSWVAVQESLARNKIKAYHKPRTNQALLTGLIYCACGGRMYPKLSRKKTAEGKRCYAYACKRKEQSHGALCCRKNADGEAVERTVLARLADFAGAAVMHQRCEALDKRLCALREGVQEYEGIEQGILLYGARWKAFSGCLEGLTTEEKRSMLGTVLEAVVWDGECVKIYVKN